MNSRAHLLLLAEYPANINFSILTRSDHNFNIRTAAIFYNNASTTVKNSLLQKLASPGGTGGGPCGNGTEFSSKYRHVFF